MQLSKEDGGVQVCEETRFWPAARSEVPSLIVSGRDIFVSLHLPFLSMYREQLSRMDRRPSFRAVPCGLQICEQVLGLRRGRGYQCCSY